jgi:hypothetical protein
MSFDLSRPGLEVPDGYSPEFTRALYDHRMGNKYPNVISEIRSRFGTERYFLEAVESVYEQNEWKLDIKTKRELKKIFNTGSF